MRLRSAVTLLLVVLLTAPPVSLSGQEEPLPVVIARAAPQAGLPFAGLPLIALAAEPIRDFRQPSLLEAARANDYATFDALYREATARGEPVGAYATLHELWTYSVTDPIGAFYGAEFYQRLARVYPGYARFIDEYRIVDDHGAVFYPTSETRAFLLDLVVEGNAPRVLLADATPARASAASPRAAAPGPVRRETRATAATEGATAAARVPAERKRSASSPTRVPRSTLGMTGTVADGRPSSDAVATTPIVASAQPTVAVPAPAATVPAPAPAPVVDTPPVVEAPVESVPAPAVAEATPVAPAPVAVRDNGFATRGILLLVIGVIGIGLLAIMLRASEKQEPMGIIRPEKPVTPFEPVKRPAASGPQAAAPPPPKDEKNRATGSRG